MADQQPHPEDSSRVVEWTEGLPTADDGDLTPLSQPLITPELASAFSVTPEPNRTILDVHRASQETMSPLRWHGSESEKSSSSALKSFRDDAELDVVDEEEEEKEVEEKDGVLGGGDENKGGSKRRRLVWTPQLHKRFVDVVAHLGIKNSVPKTITNLMNVEGLTRENVASHLQKYRLYLKGMHRVSNEDALLSPSDRLFATTPVPQNLREGPPPVPMSMPVPYGMHPPGVIPMPVIGLQYGNGGHVRVMGAANGQLGDGAWHGFAAHYPYAVFRQQRGELPCGSKSGSVFPNPHVASDK